ncbi:procollagen-lysine,2-oxoglutarate 5-dioxygenase isoform X2 [Leptidea sinapis]|uniref:procollagen-lysine,2-oxoglutarate 5-dioxygenase isoform X2 n=1 Tax=Leptidea sinapis TaxID=189913 RepID=UPI0021C3D17B|nr:procollagen-lysine,2-oxoglutarate 5-dioxygenase isoform X2 [Leptidea sinapis]
MLRGYWLLGLGLCWLVGAEEQCTASSQEKTCERHLMYSPHVLKVLSVGTSNTHGLQRFERSLKVYNHSYEILGRGIEWEGGDMSGRGGGHKIVLLKEAVEELYKNNKDKNMIIMFLDSSHGGCMDSSAAHSSNCYDVIVTGGPKDILDRFLRSGQRILFAAEPFCWPEASLADRYPPGGEPSPYLNSGGFIGHLEEVWELLNAKPAKKAADDQLHYTQLYLDPHLRKNLRIGLDHTSSIFQNLNGALSDVQLRVNVTWPVVDNVSTGTRPLVLHGNGPAKFALNRLGNYVAQAWSPTEGCTLCQEKKLHLEEEELPQVMLGVFIEQPTPFLEEFLNSILDFDYPKNKIQLFLHNNVEYHEEQVESWWQQTSAFAAAKRVRSTDLTRERDARRLLHDRCVKSACEYMVSLDSVARLQPSTLRYLVSTGYDVIAPLLVRPEQAWSNFWGAVGSDGYYARSPDYMDIVNRNIRGIWNVPFITHCYLVKMSVFREAGPDKISYGKAGMDSDMAFCESLTNLGIFMHVSNEEDFGHLLNPESFDISRTHPDIYQVIDNRQEWEKRYLHPQYWDNLQPSRNHSMPCPDVYWFPLMSMRFCQEWIAVMEAFGKWSDGSNQDNRLEGGYEAVPTRDIHMKQVGLDIQWLYILREYVRPLQELVFTGYYHNPPVSVMNFVVRYRPDEQPSLRPHHDSSTYTINLALNTPGVDYTGGGCRFIRYNCSVRDTKPGWILMHPGRLTHYHEGLLVKSGTRYIMISFVDP